jgi:hypothetical protein
VAFRNPEVAFVGRYFAAAGDRTYDVSREGDQFLMIKQNQTASTTTGIIIVQSWLDEVERLAPTGN